jgi:hypothetical protein
MEGLSQADCWDCPGPFKPVTSAFFSDTSRAVNIVEEVQTSMYTAHIDQEVSR